MADYKHTFWFLLIFSFFINCGKNDKNEKVTTTIISKEKKEKKIILTNVIQKKDTIYKFAVDSVKATKKSFLRKRNYKKKKITDFTNNQTSPQKATIPSFFYLKKIVEECKIGVLMTRKDLETNFNIPKDAMKLIKSITKTGSDELHIKWRTTWLIEKLSDTKFKDGKLKLRFDQNKLYISGTAIAIKHEKKLYSELILIGQSAYIPSVKGYYWQIGNK